MNVLVTGTYLKVMRAFGALGAEGFFHWAMIAKAVRTARDRGFFYVRRTP
jgi:hypothetical protein